MILFIFVFTLLLFFTYFKDKKENELRLFSKLMLIVGCEVKKKKII